MIVFNDVSYDISMGIIRALTLQGDVSVRIVFPVILWAGRFCKAACIKAAEIQTTGESSSGRKRMRM